MKIKRIFLALITLIILMVLGFSAFGQKIQTKPIPKPSPKPATKTTPEPTNCFSESEVNLDSNQFPPNFQGNNPLTVIGTLKKRQEIVKDEFETTRQYQARIDAEKAKPIIDNLNYESNYIFEINGDFKYNADEEQMTASYDRNDVKLANRDCTSNYFLVVPKLYGIKFPEEYASRDYIGVDRIGFPVKLDIARNLKPSLRLFLIARLAMDGGKYVRNISGTNFLIVEPKQLWVIDAATGKVLQKQGVGKIIRRSSVDSYDNVDISEQLEAANALIKAGKLDEARAELRKALLAKPLSSEAYYLLGIIYWKKNDREQAINNLRTSVFWDNRNIAAYIALVKIMLEKRDCLQAKNFLISASEIDELNEEVLILKNKVEKCSTY